MIDVTPLVGLRIRLERTIDVPCGVCGHMVVVIGQGAGPHVASLHCAARERHRGWVAEADCRVSPRHDPPVRLAAGNHHHSRF